MSVAEETEGKLQITFGGEPVHKVYLVVLRFVNNGNAPITSADFERELSCKLGDDVKILIAEVSETIPKNLEPSLSVTGNSVVLQPLLLNSGDSVTIRFLLSQFDGKIDVDARITDVKRIERHEERVEQASAYVLIGFILIGIGILGSFIIDPLATFKMSKPEILPFFVISLIGLVIMVIGPLRLKIFRRTLFTIVPEAIGYLRNRNRDEDEEE